MSKGKCKYCVNNICNLFGELCSGRDEDAENCNNFEEQERIDEHGIKK